MRKLDFTSAQLWAQIEANDEKREFYYKAVLIVTLAITLSAQTVMISVFPLLYQFTNLSNNQISHVLEFCEETATSVVQDSSQLLQIYSKNHFESREKLLQQNETREVFKRAPESCNCDAPPGPPGLPGRPGLPGVPGTPGSQGKPAILPCQPPPDYKKWCPDPCPGGSQGAPGNRGHLGDKGPKGPPGKDGKNGLDGKNGPVGPRGKIGKTGFDGLDGDAGKDAIPSPFIPGPPGKIGDSGPPGPPGPRGLPGPQGPQGEMGRKGLGGRNGVPGQTGSPGLDGMLGDPGKPGEAGVCPTYCASDGGVFFVEPPEWFFNEENR